MEAEIVSTIRDNCRRCYSCIKECPAKAIRVIDGQAVVIAERCISCGHCVKVCSQNAKKIQSHKEKVLYDLIPEGKCVAVVAPSFAASFPENYNKIAAGLRQIGFEKVVETAFGADLVSPMYKKLFEEKNGGTIISSPCPAVYNYIEKYFVGLVPDLAEVVSPMIAIGRYEKNIDENSKVVFIGPCVAKKSEMLDEEIKDAIDAVLTFTELKEIFEALNIDLDQLKESQFDSPYANLGKSFPLSGGLLKTSGIPSDVLAKEVIVVEGKENVVQVIEDLAEGKIKSKFIDILFCKGCTNGPAIDSSLNTYSRREKVINYIDENIHQVDINVWKSELYNNRNLNLKRKFIGKSQRRPTPSEEKIKEILAQTSKFTKKDELNCGACGYSSCREYAIAIAKDLAEAEMCLPYLIEKLERAFSELKETQEQLHNAEKLASIGQLAAGVAHELNNPLGTIMLYSSLLKKSAEKREITENFSEDLNQIIDEANRCKNIVGNLLNFARHGKLRISEVNVVSAISEIVKNLSINPVCSCANISINNNLKEEERFIDGDSDQIKQVFLNLINNACEAVEETEIKNITLSIKKDNENLLVDVIDTGCGIPEENIKKLFTPFFTTKKIGKGTGLGLAISYGIVKMHKGDIRVQSRVGKGTSFSVRLPYNLQNGNLI